MRLAGKGESSVACEMRLEKDKGRDVNLQVEFLLECLWIGLVGLF